ncbi:MAG: hypothetical protein LUC37_05835 [Prevotella sp.]|nr:hypothetical protein [Prevotella sp.]
MEKETNYQELSEFFVGKTIRIEDPCGERTHTITSISPGRLGVIFKAENWQAVIEATVAEKLMDSGFYNKMGLQYQILGMGRSERKAFKPQMSKRVVEVA